MAIGATPAKFPCDVGQYASGISSGPPPTHADAAATRIHTRRRLSRPRRQAGCVCEQGYYSVDGIEDGPCELCPRRSDLLGCTGTTLVSLSARPGYWRPSTRTADLCSVHQKRACAGGLLPHNHTVYSIDDDSLCRPDANLRGPYCSLCTKERYYFSTDSASCVECEPVGMYFVWIAVIAVTILSLWLCWLRRKRAATRFGYRGRCGRIVRPVLACSRLTFRVMEALGGAVMRFGELISENRTKLKIAITFYQIVEKIDDTYHVQYPSAVSFLMENIPFSLSGILKLLFGWLPIFQGVCLGLSSLQGRLIAWIVGPIAIALVPAIVMKLRGHSAVHVVHLILFELPRLSGGCRDGLQRNRRVRLLRECRTRWRRHEAHMLSSRRLQRGVLARLSACGGHTITRPPGQAASGLKSLYPL